MQHLPGNLPAAILAGLAERRQQAERAAAEAAICWDAPNEAPAEPDARLQSPVGVFTMHCEANGWAMEYPLIGPDAHHRYSHIKTQAMVMLDQLRPKQRPGRAEPSREGCECPRCKINAPYRPDKIRQAMAEDADWQCTVSECGGSAVSGG